MTQAQNKKPMSTTSPRGDSSALRYRFRETDLKDTGDSRTQQVLMIGPNKKVLEIGPATGYVTKALRELGCEITSIEIDPKAARVARRYSNRTIQGDIETLDLRKTLNDEKYDVILFGDILEHLKEPSAVLRRVRPYLKQIGRVVATVPNIAHGSVRLLMLDGNFEPKLTGLLDSTHLHFYTRKTLVELFSISGYSVESVKEIRLPIHAAENLKLDIDKYPPDLIRAIESDPEATVYQFAVAATTARMRPARRGLARQRRHVSKLLITQDTMDPLSALLTIYHARRDLQLAFPGVRHGDYNGLLRWASQSTADNSRRLMDRYLQWYRTGTVSSTDVLQLKDNQIKNLEERVNAIEAGLAWRLVTYYRRFNNQYFPPGTKRRWFMDKLALSLDIALNEGLRSLFDKALRRHPRRSTPDDQYQAWLSSNELTDQAIFEIQSEASKFSYKPKISIVMPAYNTGASWLKSAIDSVVRQAYPNWELCVVDDGSTRTETKEILQHYSTKDTRIKIRYLKSNRGISGASNEALTFASGDFVGFLDHDDELASNALFEVAKALNEDPRLDLLYTDEDKKDLKNKRVEPFFKPDWSPDLLLSLNYVCHLTVVRRSLIERAGGFRSGFEGAQDYDLVLRVTELTNRIAHIPLPLYSWRKVPGSAATRADTKPYAREAAKKALSEALDRRGVQGTVTDGYGSYYHVRYRIKGTPLVSIIIPTRDRVDLLKRCIESIESCTLYKNYEIIIVDNGSVDPTTINYLKSTRHRVIRFDWPFNFSSINNFAAKHSKGDHLLFLNNDIEVLDEHWLEAMLEHSQRPEVGMVGALLLYPPERTSHGPSRIQHAGVIIGVGGVAGHAFKCLPADRENYFNLHRVVRNCSAVTAACCMISQSAFEEVGGFDENLKVAFGDVDLCLRLREKGYLVIYTPYAVLYHHETATRGTLHPMEDEDYVVAKWRDAIFKGDPYYNPNLTLLREDYSIASTGCSIRPLAILLDIYFLRPDLQRAFPEARNGDHRRLIEWAATKGTTTDDVRVPLRAYAFYHNSYVQNRAVEQAQTKEAARSRVRH